MTLIQIFKYTIFLRLLDIFKTKNVCISEEYFIENLGVFMYIDITIRLLFILKKQKDLEDVKTIQELIKYYIRY